MKLFLLWIFANFTLSALVLKTIDASVTSEDHAVVIDAGSSGSRVHIYSWPSGSWDEPGNKLPQIREKYIHMIGQGISSLADDNDALRSHLSDIIQEAAKVVPTSQHKRTNLYLYATAGSTINKRS